MPSTPHIFPAVPSSPTADRKPRGAAAGAPHFSQRPADQGPHRGCGPATGHAQRAGKPVDRWPGRSHADEQIRCVCPFRFPRRAADFRDPRVPPPLRAGGVLPRAAGRARVATSACPVRPLDEAHHHRAGLWLHLYQRRDRVPRQHRPRAQRAGGVGQHLARRHAPHHQPVQGAGRPAARCRARTRSCPRSIT